MSKTVQISIKVEPELKEQFAAVAARQHRPMAQMIREFMWSEIEGVKIPNAETKAALEESRSGGGLHAKDTDELFRQCGIPLP